MGLREGQVVQVIEKTQTGEFRFRQGGWVEWGGGMVGCNGWVCVRARSSRSKRRRRQVSLASGWGCSGWAGLGQGRAGCDGRPGLQVVEFTQIGKFCVRKVSACAACRYFFRVVEQSINCEETGNSH